MKKISACAIVALAAIAGSVPTFMPTRVVQAIANAETVYISGRINQVHVVNASSGTAQTPISISSATGQFNGIAKSPDGSKIYHTSLGAGTVSVINAITDTVIDTVTVMGDPRAVLVSPDGAYYYVSNLSGTIYKMRASDNVRELTISNGSGTYGMGISSDGNFLYVPNNGTNVVSKVSTSTGSVVATVSTGASAGTRWVTNGNGYVVATNYVTNKVSIINEATFTELGQVTVGTNPIGVVINGAGTKAYVASERSNRIDVIDLATRINERTVGVGSRPWAVAENAAGTKLYVGGYQVNAIVVINTSTWTTSTIALTGDQSMNLVVASVPLNAPTPTTTTTTTAPTTTTTAPTTTTTTVPVASSSTTSVAPATTTSSSTLPATTVPVGQAAMPTIAPGVTPTTVQISASTEVTPKVSSTSTTSTLPPLVTSTEQSRQTRNASIAPAAAEADPGVASAIVDGKVVSTNVSRTNNQLVFTVGGISGTVYGVSRDGVKTTLDADGNMRLEDGYKIVVEGGGFLATSDVEAWMFSTPIRIGTLTSNIDGVIKNQLAIASSLEVGQHRIVLVGKNSIGQKVTLSVGFVFGSAPTTSVASRILIVVPVTLAVFIGLLVPATRRRRKRLA
ncbi:MAG: hypothetical protein RLZ18_1019 [Actinomycetota bacterium]